MKYGNDSEAFAQFVQSQAATRRAVSLSELIREWESIQGNASIEKNQSRDEAEKQSADHDEF